MFGTLAIKKMASIANTCKVAAQEFDCIWRSYEDIINQDYVHDSR